MLKNDAAKPCIRVKYICSGEREQHNKNNWDKFINRLINFET